MAKITIKQKPVLNDIPRTFEEVNKTLTDNFQKMKEITTPYKYDVPTFAWVDDDAYDDFLTNLKPTLDAKKVKTSIAVVTKWVGSW